jgi:hypothetical protein
MIAVAVVAVVLAICERRTRFQRLAREHDELESLVVGIDAQSRKPLAWAQWRSRMADKYYRAARYPWLPVGPDPPPPQ